MSSNSNQPNLSTLLPDTFYADRSVRFRIAMLVNEWKSALVINQQLQGQLERAAAGKSVVNPTQPLPVSTSQDWLTLAALICLNSKIEDEEGAVMPGKLAKYMSDCAKQIHDADVAEGVAPSRPQKYPIELNEYQLASIEIWAQNSKVGDAWGSKEMRRTNLTSFARKILGDASVAPTTAQPQQETTVNQTLAINPCSCSNSNAVCPVHPPMGVAPSTLVVPLIPGLGKEFGAETSSDFNDSMELIDSKELARLRAAAESTPRIADQNSENEGRGDIQGSEQNTASEIASAVPWPPLSNERPSEVSLVADQPPQPTDGTCEPAREIAKTVIRNISGHSMEGTAQYEKWVRGIAGAISDAKLSTQSEHPSSSLAQQLKRQKEVGQELVEALRDLLPVVPRSYYSWKEETESQLRPVIARAEAAIQKAEESNHG